MSDRKVSASNPSAASGSERATAAPPEPPRKATAGERNTGGRDDSLDADLNRERLEPGLNAEGTGGAGAPDPPRTKAKARTKAKDGNSKA